MSYARRNFRTCSWELLALSPDSTLAVARNLQHRTLEIVDLTSGRLRMLIDHEPNPVGPVLVFDHRNRLNLRVGNDDVNFGFMTVDQNGDCWFSAPRSLPDRRSLREAELQLAAAGATPYGRSMTDDVCEVVITASDEGWLIDFTRSLVHDRLAACGQHQPIRSVFRWDGVLQEERETRVALHTRRTLVEKIIERTTRSHPYDVPCVLVLPVVGGSPAYLAWVLAETDG